MLQYKPDHQYHNQLPVFYLALIIWYIYCTRAPSMPLINLMTVPFTHGLFWTQLNYLWCWVWVTKHCYIWYFVFHFWLSLGSVSPTTLCPENNRPILFSALGTSNFLLIYWSRHPDPSYFHNMHLVWLLFVVICEALSNIELTSSFISILMSSLIMKLTNFLSLIIKSVLSNS